MSIIHDALKKVQENFTRKVAPAPDPSGPPPEKEPKKVSPLSILFAIILVLVCLYFGYNQLLKNWDRIRIAFDLPNVKLQKIEIPKITVSTPTDSKPKTLSENRTPVPMAKIQTENQENLNIQGVLTQGNSTVVLINDKIYEEGDEINGIKIVSIDSVSVTILKNGKEENIRVRR